MAQALIDTDVLYKTVMYNLVPAVMETRPFGVNQYSMLGAAKFMIAKRLAKRPPARGAEAVLAEFEQVLAQLSVLEPTSEEVRLAAELEVVAVQQNLDLDSGESLLCAVLICRDTDYIFTGDKRAIVAADTMVQQGAMPAIAAKMVCLEQLFVWLIEQSNAEAVRNAVCVEPKVDTTLTNCFSCRSNSSNIESWKEGLSSYIGDLRNKANTVLASQD